MEIPGAQLADVGHADHHCGLFSFSLPLFSTVLNTEFADLRIIPYRPLKVKHGSHENPKDLRAMCFILPIANPIQIRRVRTCRVLRHFRTSLVIPALVAGISPSAAPSSAPLPPTKHTFRALHKPRSVLRHIHPSVIPAQAGTQVLSKSGAYA